MTRPGLAVAVAAVLLLGIGPARGGQVADPRPTRAGAPEVIRSDPTQQARAWQIASAVVHPGGVVIIGVDDIAVRSSTHAAIPGTLALARESVAWGRAVIYLTANRATAAVRRELRLAGYPAGQLWTRSTAPWCGRGLSDSGFRAACVDDVAEHRDVVLWLTRGPQHPTAADRTYGFRG